VHDAAVDRATKRSGITLDLVDGEGRVAQRRPQGTTCSSSNAAC